ncbi:hypothetical protein [Streptomyces sp. NPDC002758]
MREAQGGCDPFHERKIVDGHDLADQGDAMVLGRQGRERQRSRPDSVHERVRRVPDEHRAAMVDERTAGDSASFRDVNPGVAACADLHGRLTRCHGRT